MKTVVVIFLLILAGNVFAQKNSLPESLKEIPSIAPITLDHQPDTSMIRAFHADSLAEYSFLKSKKLATGFGNENSVLFSPLVEKQNGMPVVNPGSANGKWNMPVAVPDSGVDYYIKNLPLGGGKEK